MSSTPSSPNTPSSDEDAAPEERSTKNDIHVCNYLLYLSSDLTIKPSAPPPDPETLHKLLVTATIDSKGNDDDNLMSKNKKEPTHHHYLHKLMGKFNNPKALSSLIFNDSDTDSEKETYLHLFDNNNNNNELKMNTASAAETAEDRNSGNDEDVLVQLLYIFSTQRSKRTKVDLLYRISYYRRVLKLVDHLMKIKKIDRTYLLICSKVEGEEYNKLVRTGSSSSFYHFLSSSKSRCEFFNRLRIVIFECCSDICSGSELENWSLLFKDCLDIFGLRGFLAIHAPLKENFELATVTTTTDGEKFALESITDFLFRLFVKYKNFGTSSSSSISSLLSGSPSTAVALLEALNYYLQHVLLIFEEIYNNNNNNNSNNSSNKSIHHQNSAENIIKKRTLMMNNTSISVIDVVRSLLRAPTNSGNTSTTGYVLLALMKSLKTTTTSRNNNNTQKDDMTTFSFIHNWCEILLRITCSFPDAGILMSLFRCKPSLASSSSSVGDENRLEEFHQNLYQIGILLLLTSSNKSPQQQQQQQQRVIAARSFCRLLSRTLQDVPRCNEDMELRSFVSNSIIVTMNNDNNNNGKNTPPAMMLNNHNQFRFSCSGVPTAASSFDFLTDFLPELICRYLENNEITVHEASHRTSAVLEFVGAAVSDEEILFKILEEKTRVDPRIKLSPIQRYKLRLVTQQHCDLRRNSLFLSSPIYGTKIRDALTEFWRNIITAIVNSAFVTGEVVLSFDIKHALKYPCQVRRTCSIQNQFIDVLDRIILGNNNTRMSKTDSLLSDSEYLREKFSAFLLVHHHHDDLDDDVRLLRALRFETNEETGELLLLNSDEKNTCYQKLSTSSSSSSALPSSSFEFLRKSSKLIRSYFRTSQLQYCFLYSKSCFVEGCLLDMLKNGNIILRRTNEASLIKVNVFCRIVRFLAVGTLFLVESSSSSAASCRSMFQGLDNTSTVVKKLKQELSDRVESLMKVKDCLETEALDQILLRGYEGDDVNSFCSTIIHWSSAVISLHHLMRRSCQVEQKDDDANKNCMKNNIVYNQIEGLVLFFKSHLRSHLPSFSMASTTNHHDNSNSSRSKEIEEKTRKLISITLRQLMKIRFLLVPTTFSAKIMIEANFKDEQLLNNSDAILNYYYQNLTFSSIMSFGLRTSVAFSSGRSAILQSLSDQGGGNGNETLKAFNWFKD